MYATYEFTSDDIIRKNQLCPGTIANGTTYVVTQYSVDASAGLVPEVFKQTDIAALGTEEEAASYCISSYAKTLDTSSAIQYFYRVREMKVE